MQFSKDDLQKKIDFLELKLDEYEDYYRKSILRTNKENYSYDFKRIYNDVKNYILSDDKLDVIFFGEGEHSQDKAIRLDEMKTSEKFFIDDISGLINKLINVKNISQ